MYNTHYIISNFDIKNIEKHHSIQIEFINIFVILKECAKFVSLHVKDRERAIV